MNGFLKQISLWIVVLIIVVLVLTSLASPRAAKTEFVEADFWVQAQADNVKSPLTVLKKGEESYVLKVEFKTPVDTRERTDVLTNEFSAETKSKLAEYGIKPHLKEDSALLQFFLVNLLPLLLIIGVFWFFMFRQMQGGSNKAMSFGKSRAKLVNNSDKIVTFNDVAGVDEAKEELQEVIEFLKDPKKFSRLGGKIPKGVLLLGPPGSGKTLLARAVAGEGNAPFFSISGSDFVEMFVGVGASRVRDLFQQGQKHAPCIIFIDEIDAVGRQRGAGLGGGHDEREQTLNQLLVEMDGFNTNDGVIMMAATNRPDVLDKALLRPGRFDRQVVVANPDIVGREAILQIHIRNNNIPLASDVNVRTIARGTPGFSGADLANLTNEAALLAARQDMNDVTMECFEEAKDRVIMGPERRSLVIGEEEKRNTAIHEAGHALVARLLPDADPVHKVTVIPRGPSLGLTSSLPLEDRHSISKKYCMAFLRMVMGGRAAEEIVFGEFTSGASNDLKQATRMAHSMVCEWGMSSIGPISFGSNAEVFLGRDFTRERDYSEKTASAVDNEIHSLLDAAYADAKELLEKNRAMLDAIAEALVERETLDGEDLDDIIRALGGESIVGPKKVKHKDDPNDTPSKPNAPITITPETQDDSDDLGDLSPDGILPGPA